MRQNTSTMSACSNTSFAPSMADRRLMCQDPAMGGTSPSCVCILSQVVQLLCIATLSSYRKLLRGSVGSAALQPILGFSAFALGNDINVLRKRATKPIRRSYLAAVNTSVRKFEPLSSRGTRPTRWHVQVAVQEYKSRLSLYLLAPQHAPTTASSPGRKRALHTMFGVSDCSARCHTFFLISLFFPSHQLYWAPAMNFVP